MATPVGGGLKKVINGIKSAAMSASTQRRVSNVSKIAARLAETTSGEALGKARGALWNNVWDSALRGAGAGAIAGGIYGAVDERESILSGAVKGAIVGGGVVGGYVGYKLSPALSAISNNPRMAAHIAAKSAAAATTSSPVKGTADKIQEKMAGTIVNSSGNIVKDPGEQFSRTGLINKIEDLYKERKKAGGFWNRRRRTGLDEEINRYKTMLDSDNFKLVSPSGSLVKVTPQLPVSTSSSPFSQLTNSIKQSQERINTIQEALGGQSPQLPALSSIEPSSGPVSFNLPHTRVEDIKLASLSASSSANSLVPAPSTALVPHSGPAPRTSSGAIIMGGEAAKGPTRADLIKGAVREGKTIPTSSSLLGDNQPILSPPTIFTPEGGSYYKAPELKKRGRRRRR